jgi:hypothetical protein
MQSARDRVVAAAETVAEAETELIRVVRAAVAAGDSWAVIGNALGISRQAAQQRFGKDWTPPPRARKPKPWDSLTAPPFDRKVALQRLRSRLRTLSPDDEAALFGGGLDEELDDAFTGRPGSALSDEELRRDAASQPRGTPAPGTAPG